MNILIVEDQAMVRGALCALLRLENGIAIEAELEDGQQAIEYLKEHSDTIDAVLTDIEMPNVTGIELVEKIKQDYPKIKTLIVTTFGKAGYIKRALSAGVDGFLLKDAPSEELAAALSKVIKGKKVIDPELAIAALDDRDPLSEKERKALKLAAEGKSSNEMASILFLSEGTIRNYLSSAIAKLNASNRVDAARIARQKGWL